MTNNRKPVDEIRLSLSAAREDDGQPLHIATEGSLNQLPTKHRNGWTPASTKPAYSQTNVSLAHKGRDIESLMRYHEAHKKPVGYWEDAPRGMKFGGSGASAVGAQVARSATGGDAVQLGVPATPNRAAPTTTPPADGPWPKWVKWPSACLTRFDSNTSGKTWYTSGGCYPFSAGDYASSGERDGMDLTRSEALQWLEQNGHKDAAAQLRGKAADDGLYEPVGTMPVAGDVVRWGGDLIKITRIDSALHFSVRFNRAGGQEDGLFMSYFSDRRHAPLRILKRKPTAQTVAARAWKCIDGWLRCNVGAKSFMRHPHMEWVQEPLFDAGGVVQLMTGNINYTELHGLGGDAIIAECCAAMNLDPKTGEPLHA